MHTVSLLLYVYLLNAFVVALILLWAFWSDRSTANSHRLSWLVVLIASALWFVAIPLSVNEVLRKSLQQRRVLSGKSSPSRYLG